MGSSPFIRTKNPNLFLKQVRIFLLYEKSLP